MLRFIKGKIPIPGFWRCFKQVSFVNYSFVEGISLAGLLPWTKSMWAGICSGEMLVERMPAAIHTPLVWDSSCIQHGQSISAGEVLLQMPSVWRANKLNSQSVHKFFFANFKFSNFSFFWNWLVQWEKVSGKVSCVELARQYITEFTIHQMLIHGKL
jgi:hypothetical protein